MKITKYALAVLVAFVAIAAAPNAVRADDIVAVDISGLTFNGNNVCGRSGNSLCSQTLAESYQWDNTTGSVVAGSFSFSTTGVLGSSFDTSHFVPVAPGFDFIGGVTTFVGVSSTIADAAIDQLGVSVETVPTGVLPGTYTLSTNLSSITPFTFVASLLCQDLPPGPCATTAFGTFTDSFGFQSPGAVATSGTVTISAVSAAPVPEPSSLLLLGTGLLGLASAMRRKRLA